MSSQRESKLNLPVITTSPSICSRSRNYSNYNRKSLFNSTAKTSEKNNNEYFHQNNPTDVSSFTSRLNLQNSRNHTLSKDLSVSSHSKPKESSSKTLFKLKIKKSILDECDDIVTIGSLNLRKMKQQKEDFDPSDHNSKLLSMVQVMEKIGSPEKFIEKIDNYHNSINKDHFIQNYYHIKRRKNKFSFEAIKDKLNLKNFFTLETHKKLYLGVKDQDTKNIDSFSMEHLLNKVVKQKKSIVKKINHELF